MNILHITPHLGGGVGRVLLNYFSKTKENNLFDHKVACLDYVNDNAISVAKNIGLSLSDKMIDKKELLFKMIGEADIVLVHWWNHPLLYDFLVRDKLPPCRLIFWSHISGFNPPYVFTNKALKYPDLFVLTTPVSLQTKEVSSLSDRDRDALRVVWSTGGIEHVKKEARPLKHPGFNVGYIGTVDYAKIHPNFLKICSKIKIPGVKFIVCGGSSEKEFMEEARGLGIAGKFNFTGFVSDINKHLSTFDVFGYPLNPDHYGTCDQVLQESMAAGVVPVVLSNRMEKYMIKGGKTGIIAKSEAEYIKAVGRLYKDKALRNSLSKNARNYAIRSFSVDNMVKEWELIFKEILSVPKTSKSWKIGKNKKKVSAADVFLESLGEYGTAFADSCSATSKKDKTKAVQKILKLNKSVIWRADTRGTVHHYRNFFPKDKYLSFWSKLMKGNNL